ncbi:MAG: protein kinase [Acidobacteriota bacterium]
MSTDPAASEPRTAEPRATVLVVDDLEDNRDILARRLQRQGFEVVTADSGRAALAQVASRRIDLVLLDIMMPDLDGVEVLRLLRAEHDASQLPIIMQTARTDSASVVEALDAGANDYVTKPIDFPVALARIEKELRARGDVPSEPPAQRSFGEGSLLAGRYRLGPRLGAGNFGVVHRARHLELDHDVAIKILQTRIEEDDEALERFRREGRSACVVRHPNAVAVLDFGTTPSGVAYLVMELLDGRTLAEELIDDGRLSLARVAEVLGPVCAALNEAHVGGVVHRDVKPENIFLHRGRAGEVVKVLDFGIARIVGRETLGRRLTAEGFILGTPAYMAPERLRDETYDGRSDVYSLGATLFQLLAGRLPFEADQADPMALLMKHLRDPVPSLRQLAPDLPPEVDDLVQRAMAKKPDARPAVGELAEELRALAERSVRPAANGDPAVDQEAPTQMFRSDQLEATPRSRLGRLWHRLRPRSGSRS